LPESANSVRDAGFEGKAGDGLNVPAAGKNNSTSCGPASQTQIWFDKIRNTWTNIRFTRESVRMASADLKTHCTPDDLLTMPDGDLYELVGGQLAEKNTSTKSSWVATQLSHRIQSFLDEHPQGWVLTENSYECFPDDPGKVRRPDVSFIRYGKLPNEELTDGHCPIVPDVAAEVISPNDTHYDVLAKVEEYLGAGVSLVWIVNPNTRTVQIYRREQSEARFLHEDDELTGEDVLPDFRCQVRDIFPRATAQ
jgi:Uma2 family endonuclease